jgi:hypothetical protein
MFFCMSIYVSCMQIAEEGLPPCEVCWEGLVSGDHHQCAWSLWLLFSHLSLPCSLVTPFFSLYTENIELRLMVMHYF